LLLEPDGHFDAFPWNARDEALADVIERLDPRLARQDKLLCR
jgi:hypothetical protein